MLDIEPEEPQVAPAVKPNVEASSTGAIIDNVAAILPCFKAVGYTASDVYARMLDAGTEPKNKGAISTSLRKLAGRELIDVAVQGKGKSPSVYKNIDEVSFMNSGNNEG